MDRTQANRTVSVTTPLGEDVLLFKSLSFTEPLGRLFQGELELVSESQNIDFSAIVGQNITVALAKADGTPRYFNAYVSRFAQASNVGLLTRYRATLVPWLWFLTRTSDCRIFQGQTIPQIIKQLFQENGFGDVTDALTGSYAAWDYCVQYRETDFNFVSRLMEHEGIYYFFEHEETKHTIVLADSPGAHQPYPGYGEIAFRSVPDQSGREYVTDWAIEQVVQPGTVVLNDYDFTVPKKSLEAQAHIARDHAQSSFEIYDYPGEYIAAADGSEYAQVRIQELQSQHELASGKTDAMGVSTGYTFQLTEYPRDDQDREYLVTSTQCQISSDEYDSSATGGGSLVFNCRFTAIPASVSYSPPRVTPKPLIKGPQVATVSGPAGEEIYTDEYGRVKVQFPWDRYGKSNETSSCWIRVSQNWAGKQWGSVHLPRITQEVIVEFLEGDPDLPIITGRVYNGDNSVPYGLPGNKTQSGIKSRSSKGGSPANFNEIRMEDKMGAEQLYIHAEKNEDIVVENDKTENVGHNETINIGNDRTETVVHNETITVQNDRVDTVVGNETRTVDKSRTRTVNMNETVTVLLMRTHTVGINEAITVGAAQEVTVGAAQTITVGAVQSTTVGISQTNTIGTSQTNSTGTSQTNTIGTDQTTSVGGSQTNSITSDQSDTVGGGRTTSVTNDDSLTVGKTITINAGDQIIITTGDASILMKKDGSIKISGKDIIINGSGEMDVTASKNITMKGQKILQN